MSRKKHHAPKSTPPTPEAARQVGKTELPDEITSSTVRASAADRFAEWEESKIIDVLKNEFGGSGFVTLQRRHMLINSGQWAHTGIDVPIDQFSIANITQMFGGGEYRAKVRPANGQLTPRQFTFSIDHSILPKSPLGTADKKEDDKINLPALVREIAAAMPKPLPPAPPTDQAPVLEMMKFMFTHQQAAEQRRAEDQRRSDERFAKLFETMRPDAQQGGSEMDMMERAFAFQERMEERFGGKSKDGETWKEKLAEGVLQIVPAVLAKLAGGAPDPNSPALTAPLTVSDAAPPASSAQPKSEPKPVEPIQPAEDVNLLFAAALKTFRDMAAAAANAKQDPGAFTKMVLTFVAAGPHAKYLVNIFALAKDADWLNAIFKTHTGDPHAEFFREVREAVLEQALVEHAKICVARKMTGEECAIDFVQWCPEELDDWLASVTEKENWQEVFTGKIFDLAWLETVRSTIEGEVVEQPAQVVPMPPQAGEPVAPSTGAKSGAARASKAK